MSDEKKTVLSMRHINKTFPGVKALSDAQLTLREGEIHALMGENGAGKSTLMKIMTGVYTRDSGKMYLQNQSSNQLEEVEIKSPLVGQKLGLSMVFQEFNLLENMNIAENIFIGREPLGVGQTVDKKQLLQNAVEELKKVNLDIDPNTEVSKLSCGQKQCVEIAKALSFNARVVVFDEPTASLSEKESQTLFKLIKELKAKGVCIVYISHRMEEVFELSDRITVFRNGKYIDTVNTKDVQEKDIISMMIGHELNIEKKSGSEFVNKDKVVLEVKNVEVFPGAKPVNFKLYEKEILGFFGLVGAGRTELARVIFGVDPIGSGEIYVEGGKVKISSPKDAIQAGIGLVPEDRKGLGLILGMSIKDNMLISKIGQFKSSLLNKKALKNITGTFISDLGISLRNEEQEVKELSGGNQQKVVIAKWLAMKPNILIMDEPTRGIDIGAKSEIYALMRKMTEQGMSIIMISSEMSEVMQVSDRILVMHEGILRGLAYIITGGNSIVWSNDNFTKIGTGYMGPVPIPVIIMIVAIIFGVMLTTKFRFGRYIYAVGGNMETSRWSGIPVVKVKILVYVIMGVLTSIAGLIVTTRLGSGQPSAGLNFEMDCITASVVGGTSMSGGRGKVMGTIVGVLLLTVLTNGMTLVGMNTYWQQVLKGVIIVVSVLADTRGKAK